MFRKMKGFNREQAGFTLIEVMVSLIITALIGLGATMGSAQVLNETQRNNDYTTASRDVMNAVYWIGRDAQMAQVISGWSDFPRTSNLSLFWSDWNNCSYNATYSLTHGVLTRSFNVEGNITSNVVANYINPGVTATNCTSVNGTLLLTITSSVGEGSKVVNVTRNRDMTARPQL
ncbi:MAG TPA: prepilin-type N-terminal cleavage/methylation domain-containing protein [Dehalococcoidales bacterium]|nr:prepilin-type N-terminal cleavage/methylation domain-containing protein [Dehalococcoidales bacterium]